MRSRDSQTLPRFDLEVLPLLSWRCLFRSFLRDGLEGFTETITARHCGHLPSCTPSDVLRLIVPHALLGVVMFNAAYPEHYLWATTADSLRAVKHRAVTMVIQSAWLPMLRTKLICKALRDAVDSHMTGLMQPAAACNEAASTIQRALRANYLCVVNVELD